MALKLAWKVGKSICVKQKEAYVGKFEVKITYCLKDYWEFEQTARRSFRGSLRCRGALDM